MKLQRDRIENRKTDITQSHSQKTTNKMNLKVLYVQPTELPQGIQGHRKESSKTSKDEETETLKFT